MAIPNDPNNQYYKQGIDGNVFIISNYTSKPLINKVWPGVCVFPDFTNEFNALIKEKMMMLKTSTTILPISLEEGESIWRITL
jgi:hypothetical protein